MQAQRFAHQVSRLSPTAAALVTGALLGACWIGGAGVSFLVPILLAGICFGARGALAVSVLSAVLAGPMTWADAAAGTPQPVLHWVLRGLLLVLAGQVLTALAVPRTRSAQRHLSH